MKGDWRLQRVADDFGHLCVATGDRHVGSPGNRQAVQYASQRLRSAGFTVAEPEFECIEWNPGRVMLKVGQDEVNAFVSPYSLSCDYEGGFETAGSMDELAKKPLEGRVVVLHGALCREQIMPKNFTFYNPEHHQQLVRLLEEKKPAAIVAITGRNPEMAGALYPYPLFEDGDFDIPSVYVAEEQSDKVLSHSGAGMHLLIESERIPSKGSNVIGFKGGTDRRRIVFCAHIDSKKGTPGALDNGSGVAILLSLGDLLQDYRGKYGVEITLLNGEDYYANSGQMLYLANNAGRFNEIVLAVNSDGAGCAGHAATFCCINCDGILGNVVRSVFADRLVEVEPWYQSDHMIFVMNDRPAVALTSENFGEILAEIAHTPRDTVDLVDAHTVASTASVLRELIEAVNDSVD